MNARHFARSYKRCIQHSPRQCADEIIPPQLFSRNRLLSRFLVRLLICVSLCVCVAIYANIHKAQAHGGTEHGKADATMLVAHVPPWMVDAHEAAARNRAAARDARTESRRAPSAAFISRHRAPSATMPRPADSLAGPAVSLPAGVTPATPTPSGATAPSPRAATPAAAPVATPAVRSAQEQHMDDFFEYYALSHG